MNPICSLSLDLDIQENKQELYQVDTEKLIDDWFSNQGLSWENILSKLDSLAQVTIKKYGNQSLGLAYIYHKMGLVYYSRGIISASNDYLIAIDYYHLALEIRQNYADTHPREVVPEIIRGYNNIAYCYLMNSDPFNALEYVLEGLHQAERLRQSESIAKLDLQLHNCAARTYQQLGDYDQALKYYSFIADYPNEHYSPQIINYIEKWKIRALVDKGGLLANQLNQPAPALDYFQQAKEKLGNGSDEYILLANLYHNSGISYFRLEQFPEAVESYKRSIELNHRLENTTSLADNYLNLAVTFFSMDQDDQAEVLLEKARHIYDSLGLDRSLALVYDNLGDLAYKRGDLERSIELDNRAMSLILPGFKPKDILSNPALGDFLISDREGVLAALSSKLKSLLNLQEKSRDPKYLQCAFEIALKADSLSGHIRSEFQADASKLSMASITKPIYEYAIQTCWKLYQSNPHDSLFNWAFRFSEKSRAETLLEAVRKSSASSKVAPDLIAKEKELHLKVNYYEKQAALSSYLKSKPAGIYDSLLIYRRKHQDLLTTIKKDYPVYYQLIYDQNTISTDQLKQTLDQDQSLIEYFIGANHSFIFYINQDTSIFLPDLKTDVVRSNAQQLTGYLQQQDQRYLKSSHRLYQDLIQPIHTIAPLTFKLIIVPDDVLSLINFEMLTTGKSPDHRSSDIKDIDFMVFDHQISYAFSASTLKEAKRNRDRNELSFLGIAPVFKEDFSINDNFFNKLQWNIFEVRQIGKLYRKKQLLMAGLSREKFIQAVSDYNLIHLATHAKANSQDGNLSLIVFGPEENDLLYAKDLYALDLEAEMVVLSACQTGMGTFNPGEGVISLSRGFIYAGANSVITSLWNVREKINKTILLDFHQGLKNGYSKDQALRNAKIKFINTISRTNQEYTHPYFWAALICVGDMSPLPTSHNGWVRFVIFIMLLVPVVILLRKRVKADFRFRP